MQLAHQTFDSSSEPAHRFAQVDYHGIRWNLAHLDSFAFKVDLGIGDDVTVLVLFSCRRITVASEQQPNFVTLENINADGTLSLYAIFFEVSRDKGRKRRLVLRVQSAYVLEKGLNRRQSEARKVAFETLLRAAYLGKTIRG